MGLEETRFLKVEWGAEHWGQKGQTKASMSHKRIFFKGVRDMKTTLAKIPFSSA